MTGLLGELLWLEDKDRKLSTSAVDDLSLFLRTLVNGLMLRMDL